MVHPVVSVEPDCASKQHGYVPYFIFVDHHIIAIIITIRDFIDSQ